MKRTLTRKRHWKWLDNDNNTLDNNDDNHVDGQKKEGEERKRKMLSKEDARSAETEIKRQAERQRRHTKTVRDGQKLLTRHHAIISSIKCA